MSDSMGEEGVSAAKETERKKCMTHGMIRLFWPLLTYGMMRLLWVATCFGPYLYLKSLLYHS